MSILRGIVLAAVFTPLCWVLILFVFRKLRSVAAMDVGLPYDLLNEIERRSWLVGVMLALALSGLLGDALWGQ